MWICCLKYQRILPRIFRTELVKLKGMVTPIDVDAPEVDLRIVVGNAWEKNPMLYYKNIRRDAIDIWN